MALDVSHSARYPSQLWRALSKSMSYSAIKDNLRESQLFTTRAVIALICIILTLSAIVGRMVYLQILSHDHFTTLSNNNRVSIQPLPPTRGLIFDRNGVILAQNLPTYTLEIVPERTKDLDKTIADIAELIEITESDIKRFYKRLKHQRRFRGTPLRLRLTEEEAARIAVHRHRLAGVEVEARLTRDYPLGSLTVHAIGYVGRINEKELAVIDRSNYAGTSHIGKLGIEKSFEHALQGEVGSQHVETNVLGRTIRVLERTPPKPGQNLILTLDSALQKTAKEALGDRKGAVVAIDPRDGSVLVLASRGDYDPNLFVNGIDYASYEHLRTSPYKPLFNRALRGQYPPGSTIKPFVGLAGLELGQTSMHDSIFCRGWYTLPGDERRYRDWKKTGHGHTDLHKSIVESCDVYYYDLARVMGIDRINSYLSQFGFGQKTGIDIAGERSGILPSTVWKRQVRGKPWYLGETLIAGIGQGYNLTTPLQLAVSTAALANRGRYVQPHLLSSEQQSSIFSAAANQDLPRFKHTAKINKEENWDYIIEAMKDVIYGAHGTAKKLNKGQPYKIAGKTGTAQVFGIKQDEEYVTEDIAEHLRDHALFIAFAPLDNPKIAIAVIVENGGSGGAVAGPVAGAVIDHYLGGHPL